MTVESITAVIRDAGVVGLLALAIIAWLRGQVISRREYDDMRTQQEREYKRMEDAYKRQIEEILEDRDDWRRVAVSGTDIAERATSWVQPPREPR